MKVVEKKSVAFVVVLLLTVCYAGQALAWWNPQWEHRVRIDLDGSPAGAALGGTVADAPMLIRLHSGNFDFTKARQDGADLRFVSGDDKELLKYHFESFDSLEELALVWVKIPKLTGGPNAIYLYYGNDKAAKAEDAAGTYDTGQSGVFHFSELEGKPADSTAYKNSSLEFQGGQGMPALIGRGISLMGAQDTLVLPGTTMKIDKGFSFAAWVRLPLALANAPLLRYMNGDKGLQVSIDGTGVSAGLMLDNKKYQTAAAGDLTPGSWHHLAVTGVGGGPLTVFVDGEEVANVKLPAALPDLTAQAVIGGGETGAGFAGEIDEVRFSNLLRSPDLLKFAARTEGPSAAIAALGAEEVDGSGGGLPLSYLSTIAANISMDGWLIIVILLIIAAMSWFVMLSKAYIFYTMERGNKMFRRAFDRLTHHASFDEQDDMFEGAPLYRIYQEGYRMLHDQNHQNSFAHRDDGGEAERKNFQFAIERSYLGENKRMNTGMTIMTLAISGGPFLGLLGTVWGVMNTFAAMAEAGEANIMAIAPGVASALATTVFGLIVAIPALFGYNFLVSKIKSINHDLSIFLDEYVIKVEGINGKNKA